MIKVRIYLSPGWSLFARPANTFEGELLSSTSSSYKVKGNYVGSEDEETTEVFHSDNIERMIILQDG